MGNRPVVDEDKCIGAGLCAVASSYFELSDDGKVMLLRDGEIPESDLALVSDAAVLCPAEAIRIQQSTRPGASADGEA